MGNKNSGRHSRHYEIMEGRIENICADWLIREWPHLGREEKMRVAMQIVPRMVTTRSETATVVVHISPQEKQAMREMLSEEAARIRGELGEDIWKERGKEFNFTREE